MVIYELSLRRPKGRAESANCEEFLPILGRRHVVPGLERRRERADVRIAEEHCDFEGFEARITEVINCQLGAYFREDLLEAGFLRLESTLKSPATELEGPTGRIGIGFATGHQIRKPSSQLARDIVLLVK